MAEDSLSSAYEMLKVACSLMLRYSWTRRPGFDVEDHLFVQSRGRGGGSKGACRTSRGNRKIRPRRVDRKLWKFSVFFGGRAVQYIIPGYLTPDSPSPDINEAQLHWRESTLVFLGEREKRVHFGFSIGCRWRSTATTSTSMKHSCPLDSGSTPLTRSSKLATSDY